MRNSPHEHLRNSINKQLLKLGKKSAKSQAMERIGPAERENGLFRREQFPRLSRKRPLSLALKPNDCDLEKGVGKPTGAAEEIRTVSLEAYRPTRFRQIATLIYW
jgi:hypothetical protein